MLARLPRTSTRAATSESCRLRQSLLDPEEALSLIGRCLTTDVGE
jgi:hypothetical protein